MDNLAHAMRAKWHVLGSSERPRLAGVRSKHQVEIAGDSNHTPELICALTRFDALCGFRKVSEAPRRFDLLRVSASEEIIAPLHHAPNVDGLARTFDAVISLDPATVGPP